MHKTVVIAIGCLAVLLGLALRDDPQTYLLNSYAEPLSWPLFYAVNGAALFFQLLSNKLKPPPMKLVEDVHGFMVSRIVFTVTELNVATLLGDDALTVEDLAMQAHVKAPQNLQRLMRAAQSLGYFYEDAQGRWRNNRLSSLLREEHPTQLKFLAQSTSGFMFPFWEHLLLAVRNTTAHDRQALVQQLYKPHQADSFWTLLAIQPEKQYLFQKTMVAFDAVTLMGIVLDYDWSQFSRVVDIGAQEGSFLKQLLVTHATTLTQGVLFDMPHVVVNAERAWSSWPEKARVTFVGGDFFIPSTLPKAQDKDVYVLRNILHDWSDQESIEILKNLRTAMGSAKTTLVIVELVPAVGDPFPGPWLIDMHMLLIFGGKEREVRDWHELFRQTGFEFIRVHQTRSPYRVVEARPV